MTKKIFYNLDSSWVNNTQINLSAVERRTSTLTKRRTVKKEFQVAWLLKAITLIDLYNKRNIFQRLYGLKWINRNREIFYLLS